MSKQNDYILASEKEKDIFILIIDKRVEKFRKSVENYYKEKILFNDLFTWLKYLQKKLKEDFSDWYDSKVRGRKIPKNIVIPKPRQDRIYRKYSSNYEDKTCEVCGDRRVLNIAHIIPREDGGPDEEWNLMRLCANHHYLFDNRKLTEDEWNSIDWKSKDKRVIKYIEEKRLPVNREF